ncbi:MAG: hypothetical protein U1E27_02855, partial [Kiritimatiellia bacterium]|nr:hypothetical protein [Kiritimatiellia bacterium]
EERYEEALDFFTQAERAAESEKQDPAFARFNQALALMRMGRTEEAVGKWTAALETTDLDLQARAQYALGTLRGRMADEAASGEDLKMAAQAYEESLRGLESSLRMNASLEDAKVNFELAQARLQEVRRRIEEQPQEQKNQKPEKENQEEDQEKQEPQKPDQQNPSDPTDPTDPSDQADPQDQAQPEPSQGMQDESEPSTQAEPGEETDRMTEEEAKMILEARREEEEAQRQRMRVNRGAPEPVARDW